MRPAVRLALLALALSASAQPALEFSPLGAAEGLSGNAVTAVEGADEGAVWLGTSGAADRFDGGLAISALSRAYDGEREQEVRVLFDVNYRF